MSTTDYEKLDEIVRGLSPVLVREVLDFALFLQEKRQLEEPAKPAVEWSEERRRGTIELVLDRDPDYDWGFEERPGSEAGENSLTAYDS